MGRLAIAWKRPPGAARLHASQNTHARTRATHQTGTWDDISGEAFLRQLLSMPIESATYKTGRQALFNNVQPMGVDPRK